MTPSAQIAAYLRAGIKRLAALGVDAARVYAPNERATPTGDVYFQIAVTSVDATLETERQRVARYNASIVVNLREGEGVRRADAIADELMRFFNAPDEGGRGFSIPAEDAASRPAFVYLNSARREPAKLENARFRVPLFLAFELHET